MKQEIYNADPIIKFLSFCINLYAERKSILEKQAFFILKEYGVLEFLENNYEMEHCLSESYIFDDMASIIEGKASIG